MYPTKGNHAPLGAQLTGQTDKTLNALLQRVLEDTGLTERLWGDLPTDELATTGRVLGVVLTRATAELAEAQAAR